MVLHPSPVPRLAVDVDGLAEALSLPTDEVVDMIAARAWLSGHLPMPVEVGRPGRAVHRIWSVAEITRWLQRGAPAAETTVPQPQLVDYRGLARLLGYTETKLRHLQRDRAWERDLLPWPLFDDQPQQRMWAIAEVHRWITEATDRARRGVR